MENKKAIPQTNQNDTNSVRDNEKNYQLAKDKMLRDDITVLGGLNDLGQVEYQVEWQRLGTLQQSASVLIGILAVFYVALITFLSVSNEVTKTDYFKNILLPTLFWEISFSLVSLILFIIMIWPKYLVGIRIPSEVYNLINDKDLHIRFTKYLKMWDNPLKELGDYLQKKLVLYNWVLIFTGYCGLIFFAFLFLLILKMWNIEINSIFYYITMVGLSIIYFFITYSNKIKKES